MRRSTLDWINRQHKHHTGRAAALNLRTPLDRAAAHHRGVPVRSIDGVADPATGLPFPSTVDRYKAALRLRRLRDGDDEIPGPLIAAARMRPRGWRKL